jgi:hypothetical protein
MNKISVTNHQPKTCDFCYVSKILTVGSEPVISFINRAYPFGKVCLFDFYDIVIQKRNSLLKGNRNYMEGVKP